MIGGETNYTVCELEKTYAFGGRRIKEVRLAVSGDTAFALFSGGRFLFRGPAGVGGDFLYNEILRPEYYATAYSFIPEDPAKPLTFTALVRMGSVRINEYSRGAGGFSLCGTVLFADGGSAEIMSDCSWRIRVLGAYNAPCRYDGAAAPSPFVFAEKKEPRHPDRRPRDV